MEWQGIEWAVGVFELAMLLVPIAGFVRYRRCAARQTLGKAAALRRYAALSIAPTVAYAALVLVLIGIEDLTSLSLLSEEMGRAFPFLVAGGLVVWLIAMLAFGLALLFIRHPATPPGRAGGDAG